MDAEWLEEPLRKEWESSGLPCVLLRDDVLDVWKGYVGVDRSHPAYCVESTRYDLDVHGGVWVSFCGEGSTQLANGYYWFKFDCGHLGDVHPNRVDDPMFGPGPMDRYRNIQYAIHQAESLAAQLAKMKEVEVP